MMVRAESGIAVKGILLVDKPQGLSSNALLQQVKRLFKAKKAGHTGSLDPLATGMLPICFGEATKFCQYLLDADKSYEATGLLGVKTTTADALGEVIASSSSFNITEDELETALNQFRGSIKQVPSMYSALKHKGTPLYKYAREGLTIEREARDISIYRLELLAFDGYKFDIRVNCSKGTYIRNLVEDIGELLGVGAHLTRLHRIHTAGFAEEEMYTLAELQTKLPEELTGCLLPMERAVNYLPILELKAEDVTALRQGKVLDKLVRSELQGYVRLHDEGTGFVGLGEVNSVGNLSVKRLLAFD